jgi:hypothetical protein
MAHHITLHYITTDRHFNVPLPAIQQLSSMLKIMYLLIE